MTNHIHYGSGPDQFGELTRPAGAGPHHLVVLIHGGFWRDRYRLDLMHPLVDPLAGRGFATWNIEYRRVGSSGGGYPFTLDDVAEAIDHVAGGEWATISVIGHSAGGHLALWNAARANPVRSPDLTVALAPVADVIAANRDGVGVDATANFFGGDHDDVPDAYATGQPDPERFAGRVVLVHGTEDDSVPLAQSHLIEAHVDRLAVLHGADHFDVIDPDHQAWAIVFEELEQLRSSG